ncbi:uncharacterized protein (TIGR04141 family) [Curtobacterium sp. PhB146]|nr:uncharacterized protein (TIGR04141 family) [Curtobacterium sp. PhB146]
MSWPHERLQVDGTPDYTKVWIPGGTKFVINGPLDVSALFDYLEVWNADGYDIAAVLDNARVKLFHDEACKPSSAVSRELPLRQWLMYEATSGSKRFCFYDARWYEMDQDYLSRIDDLVAGVFENQPLVQLDPWTDGLVDEDAYNKFLAEQLEGIVMDKKLVRTDMHRRGIEMCDVYVPGAALVHVKRADSSAQVSHLLAQGLVSADSLRRDEQARREFQERLRGLTGDAEGRSDWKQVIFGLARPRPIDAASLFSFSKVNLVRQVQYLRSFAIDVAIVHIPRSEGPAPDGS